MQDITEHLVQLVRATSTDLSPDVEHALRNACQKEADGSAAQARDNPRERAVSRETGRPICQDTGTPIFYVWHPVGVSQRALGEQIRNAVRIATERAYLRPNAVAALSGKNSGDNTGVDFPTIHFEEWEHGCQYSVPSPEFQAGRDIAGVRKAVLDAAFKAQGFGCAPGVLGVGVGGDRVTSMQKAKEQLFRPLEDENPDPELDAFEKTLRDEVNQLGIGPMGFGGKTTVLGVKAGQLHRLPACFFVSVAYMCWADRRKTLTIRDGQATIEPGGEE
jgi:fumarate hydratase class I